jgi:hypothetical protein
MRLGEMLIQRQLIQQDDLDRALEIQRERNDKLGKILVDLGFVALRDVLAALSEQLSVPLVTLDSPPPRLRRPTASPRFMRQCRFIPVALTDSTLTWPWPTRSTSRPSPPCGFHRAAGRAALAAEQEILDAIDKYYGEAAQPRRP